jgi:hypothetical protein
MTVLRRWVAHLGGVEGGQPPHVPPDRQYPDQASRFGGYGRARGASAAGCAGIGLAWGVAVGTQGIKALDETTWAAFAALVERNNGVFGGCWCMGFHPEGVGRPTTPSLNRERKLGRVRAGTAHAALVFRGNDCVGWCQFGSPEELPRIKSRAAYDRAGSSTPPDWRIGCCFVGKGYRRRGVAVAAIAGALDLIAAAGGGLVEGYPEDAGSVPAGFLFNGALSSYEQLGFHRDRRIGKHRWVVTKVVE